MRPTFDQYVDIGNDFKVVCDICGTMYVKLSNVFGIRSTEPLLKISETLNKMKSDMDDWVSHEFPDKSDEDVKAVFYGSRQAVCVLDDIPDTIKHTKLTYDQYKSIGNEVKRFRNSVRKLALKSQMLHGKTKVRPLLNLCGLGSPFTSLLGNLQTIEYNDLRESGIKETILFDVFWGDLSE
jgi:hypothetical protein